MEILSFLFYNSDGDLIRFPLSPLEGGRGMELIYAADERKLSLELSSTATVDKQISKAPSPLLKASCES